MHHAAIINNLCLENSGIILYSKAECSFTHQGDSFAQAQSIFAVNNTYFTLITHLYMEYTYVLQFELNLQLFQYNFPSVLLEY